MSKNLVIAGLVLYGAVASGVGYGLIRINCFMLVRYQEVIGRDIGERIAEWALYGSERRK